ncbi:MAG: hypothetical protein JST55_07045 [Bacteroidetes bacterium]|nr:hypothetical protein [Bacteroidota bacterium]
MKHNKIRKDIIQNFAMWTALSSTRSGCPIKARKDIYSLLEKRFDRILSDTTKIEEEEFNEWHEKNVKSLVKKKIRKKKSGLPLIWAAKIINIYLKTAVYLGGLGNSKLIEFIHPPIDSELLKVLKKEVGKEIFYEKIGKFEKMVDIKTYNDYKKVILGIKELINNKYLLIEIEQFWQSTGD